MFTSARSPPEGSTNASASSRRGSATRLPCRRMPRHATTRPSEAGAHAAARATAACDPALALLTHAPRGLLVLEHGNHRRRSAQSQLLPPRHHVLVGLLGQLGALGEGLDEAIVHAGIDQTFRSPGS